MSTVKIYENSIKKTSGVSYFILILTGYIQGHSVVTTSLSDFTYLKIIDMIVMIEQIVFTSEYVPECL